MNHFIAASLIRLVRALLALDNLINEDNGFIFAYERALGVSQRVEMSSHHLICR